MTHEEAIKQMRVAINDYIYGRLEAIETLRVIAAILRQVP